MELEFSKHALEQMERRCITKEIVELVVGQPDSVIKEDDTISIYSKLVNEGTKHYLYRVFVNYYKSPSLIITAYKTSKIEKYGY
jgi:hypothetical protein